MEAEGLPMSRHLKVWMVFLFVAAASAALADSPGRIAGGKASTTVPFVFSKNHIFVMAFINGKGPFPLIFDSGAERNVLDNSLVQLLKLKTKGKVHLDGIGPQSMPSLQTENTVMQIGDATLSEQKFVIYDFGDLKKLMSSDIAGILGRNVFRDFVVKIDYGVPQLVLTLPSQFVYHGTGTVLPISFDQHHLPQIDGNIDGLKGRFNIDTGFNDPLLLFAPFVQKNGLQAKYAAQSQASKVIGAGGAAKIQIVPSLPFQFGEFNVSLGVEMSVELSGMTSNKDTAGQIGNQLLQYFNPTFDYSHSRVIFEQPSAVGQATPAQSTTK